MSEMTLVLIGVALGLAVAFMLWWINGTDDEPHWPYFKGCSCAGCGFQRKAEAWESDDRFLLGLVVLDKDAEIEDYQW